MEELIPMPPIVADLVWTPDGESFVAPCTKAFLVLWSDGRQEDLFQMGFFCRSAVVDGRRIHQVRWTPDMARAGYLDDIAMLEKLYAAEIGHAKRQEAGMAEIAGKRAVERAAAGQAYDAGLVERQMLVREAQDNAATYLACCPDLLTVRQHQLLTMLVDREDLHDTDIAQLRRVFAAIEGEVA